MESKTKKELVNQNASNVLQNADLMHAQFLPQARKFGQMYGNNEPSLPPLDADSYLGFIDHITSFYIKGRTDMLMSLQSDKNVNDQESHDLEIKEKEDLLKKSKSDLMNKASDMEDIKFDRSVEKHKFYSYVLGVIMLLETSWMSMTFSAALNDSNIMVWVGAFILSFGLIMSIKVFTKQLRDKPWKEIPIMVKVLIPMYVFSVVIAFGLLRFSSVIVSSDNTISTYSYLDNPFIYIVMTLVPIVATACVVYTYYLSDEDSKNLERKNQLQKECNALQDKINTLQKDIKELKALKKDNEVSTLDNEALETLLIQKFDAYYGEAIGVFKYENIKWRQDGCPKSFNNPTPTLPKIKFNHR